MDDRFEKYYTAEQLDWLRERGEIVEERTAKWKKNGHNWLPRCARRCGTFRPCFGSI